MARVVILEGPDGSGKTTAAKKLMEKGFTYRHEGPPPEGHLALYYYNLVEQAAYGSGNVVFDRLHLGETIYGPIARGSSRLRPYDMETIHGLIKTVNARFVLCLPPFKVCHDAWSVRHKQGKEFLTDENDVRKVYNLYYSWWLRSSRATVRVLRYDWTAMFDSELFNFCEEEWSDGN